MATKKTKAPKATEIAVSDLKLTNPDINGVVPDQALVRETFVQQADGKNFMLMAYAWNLATNCWDMILMERYVDTPVPIVRPLSDATILVEDGNTILHL